MSGEQSTTPAMYTAREVLVAAAGKKHELHSAVALARSKETLTITCSCGKIIAVPNTEETRRSLRNVPMMDMP